MLLMFDIEFFIIEQHIKGRDSSLLQGLGPGAALTVVEVGRFSAEDGRRGLTRLLAAGEGPTAVVGAGAVLCLGILEEAGSRGRQVPGDLAVVGYGDAEVARFAAPALTMVGFPERAAGVQAAEMLAGLLAGRRVRPRRRRLAAELRVRRSCGCG